LFFLPPTWTNNSVINSASPDIVICPDINECDYQDIYPCYGNCRNTHGGYDCQCPLGFKGNASEQNGCEVTGIKIMLISSLMMLSLPTDHDKI
jgi:hypothetical protein